MTVADKLSRLRQQMSAEGIDAFLVANADAHHNELVAERYQARQWLIDFKASAGTVVVTRDWCGLWADSRYTEAAKIALEGTEVVLMRASDVDCPPPASWLKSHLEEGATIGFDGGVTDEKQARAWIGAFEPAGLAVRTELDLIDRIWPDRPADPSGELFLVPEEYTGESIASKVERLRAKLSELKVDAHLLGRTDESAWLFNYRGAEQKDNTTANAYTLVTRDDVFFFVDPAKLGEGARQHFERGGVTLRDYDEVESALEALPPSTRLLLDPQHTSHRLFAAGDHCVRMTERAPVTDMKGVKNDVEIGHFRQALIDDGAAYVKLYHWLFAALDQGQRVGELDCSRQISAFRAQVNGFRHDGFEAIVGYAEHGALNHYAVTEKSSKTLARESLLLIDSGGNYRHGLTDTTRTIALGPPSAQQKEDYTYVLKALIDLVDFEFAEGATGAQLDGICRAPLWAAGRNFQHGTGHGVGFGLEVHEGPQNFSSSSTEKFILGQVTTIEPGCYRGGQWGVRLENMVHTVLSRETEFGRFFRFENLTFCPFDLALIEPALLSDRQIEWLDAYHAETLEKLSPLLDDSERAWLEQACRPLAS